MATEQPKRQARLRIAVGTLRGNARSTGIDGTLMMRGFNAEGEEVEVDVTSACRGFTLDAKAGELDVVTLQVINYTIEDPDGQLQ